MPITQQQNQIWGLIYYTPVENPESIQKIEIIDESKLHAVIEFIEKKTKRKKSPDIREFTTTGLNETLGRHINSIKSSFPNVTDSDIQTVFEVFSNFTYGRSRTSNRHWGLILSKEFFFIYHFTPDKGITYQDNQITEFIKYLDGSTLTRFIFLTKKQNMQNFCDMEGEEFSDYNDINVLTYTFDHSNSKGFRQLTSTEPVYESKGEIKIRSESDEDTDVVVETQITNIPLSGDAIKVDFSANRMSLNANLTIKEYEINSKKYSSQNSAEFFAHMEHERSGIANLTNETNFYSKTNPTAQSIKETDTELSLIGSNGRTIKTLRKQINNIGGKRTIGILSKHSLPIIRDGLIESVGQALSNDINFCICEIATNSRRYCLKNIGDFSLFLKWKEDRKLGNLCTNFQELQSKLTGTTNSLYRKVLTGCYLLCSTKYMQRKDMQKTCQLIAINSLRNIFGELSPAGPNLQLKEIDKLGVEFKAGVLGQGRGFFENSPTEFATKLKEKFASKRKDLVVFFIGINEDSMNFSPVLLSRVRNEFKESVVSGLESNNIYCPMFESIPIDDRGGILIIALQKTI